MFLLAIHSFVFLCTLARITADEGPGLPVCKLIWFLGTALSAFEPDSPAAPPVLCEMEVLYLSIPVRSIKRSRRGLRFLVQGPDRGLD